MIKRNLGLELHMIKKRSPDQGDPDTRITFDPDLVWGPVRRDEHLRLAAEIFQVSEADVTQEQRDVAKRARFALTYPAATPVRIAVVDGRLTVESAVKIQDLLGAEPPSQPRTSDEAAPPSGSWAKAAAQSVARREELVGVLAAMDCKVDDATTLDEVRACAHDCARHLLEAMRHRDHALEAGSRLRSELLKVRSTLEDVCRAVSDASWVAFGAGRHAGESVAAAVERLGRAAAPGSRRRATDVPAHVRAAYAEAAAASFGVTPEQVQRARAARRNRAAAGACDLSVGQVLRGPEGDAEVLRTWLGPADAGVPVWSCELDSGFVGSTLAARRRWPQDAPAPRVIFGAPGVGPELPYDEPDT